MASVKTSRDPLSGVRGSVSRSLFQVPAQNHERIKLLMMLTNFNIGGTERQVTDLALRIDLSRFELHLACMRNSGELLRELEPLQAPRPVFQIGRLYAIRTLWQAVRLALYIKRNLIQIVHSYGYYPNVFAVPAAKLARASVVIASIRDKGDVLTPFKRRLQKLVCRLADCVLVNAEAIRETLIAQGYRPDNIVVIRNGVALPSCGERQKGAALRQALGFDPSTPVVMVFSRLNRMKGVEYFLDAAAMVASRIPVAQFLIVGDGASRPELEKYAAHLGLAERIAFTGFRTDGRDLLLGVSVSVLPSLSEGLSNSLLESMASGVPVIAARVGGNPEIVEDGVSGFLVPPRDAVALAGAIITLLEHRELASRFGEAGRRRVAELFSMERSVGEVERLYQRLVETRAHV
jgi:glycosyltransferase involved in cell wall biosynthesis